MELINSVEDFFKLIDGGSIGGYTVCFADASYHADDWTAEHFIEHLINLSKHCIDSRIIIECKSVVMNNRIEEVLIIEHHPVFGDSLAKDEWTRWRVLYH